MSASLPEVLSRLPEDFEFVSLRGDRLTLRTKAPMLTVERGHTLLELEKRLHREVGPIDVFLEPKGDINQVRVKMRGVKV
jgi:hypothetical protein